MVRKEKKIVYTDVKIEVLSFEANDIVTASDLFTDSNNPGGSTSSGSWT